MCFHGSSPALVEAVMKGGRAILTVVHVHRHVATCGWPTPVNIGRRLGTMRRCWHRWGARTPVSGKKPSGEALRERVDLSLLWWTVAQHCAPRPSRVWTPRGQGRRVSRQDCRSVSRRPASSWWGLSSLLSLCGPLARPNRIGGVRCRGGTRIPVRCRGGTRIRGQTWFVRVTGGEMSFG